MFLSVLRPAPMRIHVDVDVDVGMRGDGEDHHLARRCRGQVVLVEPYGTDGLRRSRGVYYLCHVTSRAPLRDVAKVRLWAEDPARHCTLLPMLKLSPLRWLLSTSFLELAAAAPVSLLVRLFSFSRLLSIQANTFFKVFSILANSGTVSSWIFGSPPLVLLNCCSWAEPTEDSKHFTMKLF